MSIALKTFDSQSDLLGISQDILELFSTCFPEKKLEYNLWEWAYILNPYGGPCVSVAYDEKRIVGHYGTIPIDLVNMRGDKLSAHLSMTTMVDKKYTKHGLFKKLAELNYSNLESRGTNLVYGYPNKNSKPGFKKRLGWSVSEMKLSYFNSRHDFLETKQYKSFYENEPSSYTIDLLSPTTLDWRMSKPGVKYVYIDGAYYKPFANSYDLVYIQDRKKFESVSCDIGFNAICYADDCNSDCVDYDFGFRGFRCPSNFSLFSQLSCSDIF